MIRPLFLATPLLLAGTAAADPPPNADPALAPWFRSLVQPGTSVSCCSVSDCRATDYRVEGDHYEALIGEARFAVPVDKILQRTDNPTGRAVVCWTPQRGILCFVRDPPGRKTRAGWGCRVAAAAKVVVAPAEEPDIPTR